MSEAIEEIKFEVDVVGEEHRAEGFLTITGDFSNTFETYLDNEKQISVSFRLNRHLAEKLFDDLKQYV